jgi:hypothetical protein
MSRNVSCEFCSVPFSIARTACPHCGRPQRFPNVMAARDDRHAAALQQQYDSARDSVRGKLDREFADLERHASGAQAVLSAKPEKLEPMMQNHFDILPNYWDLQDLRSTTSDGYAGPDWHNLRQKAEIELVESAEHRERLHYAALSLDGTGLPHYGECVIVLRESMIAHRATVYRTNSALEVSQSLGATLQPGGLAEWQDRGRLVATKLVDQLRTGMGQPEFQQLLLRLGKPENKGLDDVFVEVLIFGELTMHSFAGMTVTVPAARPTTTSKRAIPRQIQSRYRVWEDRCQATLVEGQPVAFNLKSLPQPKVSNPEPGVT